MRKNLIILATIAVTAIASEARTVGPLVSDATTVTSTAQGKVQGYKDGEIYTFKGIPYAKAERFMPPQAPDKHDGVLMTRNYGPKAPQPVTLNWKGIPQSDNDFGFQFVSEPMDEKDCLVLNIWTKGLNDGKKRPVFVWFHGGGFHTGSGHDLPCYEGRALAEKGDIVVVNLNHRLNTLGYFDMSGLGGRYSDSANLGQQDLVAALKWINENIENFGGDPSNVTIGGQSGGGGKVSTVMMMPEAQDLFNRAIVQSGSFARQPVNTYGELYAKALLNELGLRIEDVEELNAVPYDRLCDAAAKAQRAVNMTLQSQGVQLPGGMAGPVMDGKHIVGPGFEDGKAPEVSEDKPMMIGWNFNEFDMQTGKEDTIFRDAAIAQANNKATQGKAPVYLYLFNWKPEGNTLGACHGMELPFMFGNVELQPEMTGATKEAYALQDKITDAWISFIRTGNPNTKSLPKWKEYNPETQPTMVFDNKCSLREK